MSLMVMRVRGRDLNWNTTGWPTVNTCNEPIRIVSNEQKATTSRSEVVLRYEPSTVYKLAGDTNLSSLAELLPKLAFICPKDQKLSLVISFRM